MQKLAAALAAGRSPSARRMALKGNKFTEVPDKDIDVEQSGNLFGSHINTIPLQSAVAAPRLFYGARFLNQAMPLVNPEAPLVQNLDEETGKSYDELMGKHMGALHADEDGVIEKIEPDYLHLRTASGKKRKVGLYRDFPFNRKSAITQTPVLQVGQPFKKGDLLAKSNFTDPTGTMAMGVNARVGLVPYKGKSMDDAIVVSEAFAKRITSQHLYGHDLDYKKGVKGGKAHYMGIFPRGFNNEQLGKLDDDGVVRVGQVLHAGDPIVLATKPRVVSSTTSQLGLLSKHMRNARMDAALKWDEHTPGRVVDVEKVKGGVKVNIASDMPAKPGDKIVMRTGQKGTISEIIPDEHMQRTADGQPLEVLLNPLGLPSRVNDALPFELLLGKLAKKQGQPIKVPAFTKPGDAWHELVEKQLKQAGIVDAEEVFDPQANRKLQNPVTVGYATVLKLHHTSHSKLSTRGQGAYSSDGIPLHGGGEEAAAKRLSGLETNSLLSSGAYNLLRESATLRGSRNDDYWRALRQGHEPKEPGTPFTWDKFNALLNGAGYHVNNQGKGQLQLQMWTDKDLERRQPMEVRSGDIVDIGTLQPIKGGLFDDALTGSGSWGYIKLPHPVPNPAAEDMIRDLLGLTKKQFQAVMAGEMELPSH